MKKCISFIVAICMMVTITPCVFSKEDTRVAQNALTTNGNFDLVSSGGKTLQDELFQYSVGNEKYDAYMWVPENSEHITGVMIAKSNLAEARLMHSVTIREVCAKQNIAMVYYHMRNNSGGNDGNNAGVFDYTEGDAGYGGHAGEIIDEMMNKFAATSGYDELRYAPFIAVGHSAALGMAWKMGSWDPNRTIAQISIKGGGNSASNPDVVPSSLNDIQPGVPTYICAGQFTEHATGEGKINYFDSQVQNIISNFRAKGADRLVSASVEWEAGHYDFSEQSCEIVADYINRIVPKRVDTNKFVAGKITEDYQLNDLTKTGYLASVDMFGKRNKAPVQSKIIKGDISTFTEEEQKNLLWFIDEAQYNYVKNFTSERRAFDAPDPETIDVVAENMRCYNIANGNLQEWPAGNVLTFLRKDVDIVLKVDLSAIKAQKDLSKMESIKLSMTRKADSSTPQQKSYVNVFENSPWDVNGNFTVPAPETLTRVGEYTEREPKVDIKTTVINDADGILYFHLTWNDTANGTGGNDYYGINNANTAAEKPHIELVESSIGIVAPKKTLHQYPQIEEKNKPGQIKPFGTMTRYDYNGLDKTYAYEKQVDGDPMSFSLVAIKPNKIPNNHFGAGTKADFSAEPLFINPMMAPVEWVGVTPEPTESGDSLDIGSQWRNYLRWKNNRLFYKLPSQDSYLNLTTYETVDNKGNADASDDDVYSYATNAFNIVPTKQNTGTEQIITFNDVADVTKTIEAEKPSFASFNISPKSSVVDLPVDIMVEYGPVKVASSRNADGSYDYTVSADRIPKGAKYPIEVKLVATQFGVAWGGRTVKTAKPVEKIFYINENSGVSTEAPVNDGEIFGTELLAKNITGFNVIGNGTIALSQNQNPGFTSLKAATLRNERLNTADVNYKKHYVYKEGYNPTDYWSDFGNTWTAVVSGDGFIPLSAFTKNEKNNIDLRLINQLKRTGNITSITPVSTQTEVINPRTMPWGSGVNVVWQNAQGASYDRVEIYDGQTKVGSALNGESRVYVPITADKELMVKTIKGENASPGIPIQAKYLPSKYIVDDFETGDLSAGSNWVSESARSTNDAYSNSLGAILTINKDAQNHYLAVGHGYTGLTPQTVETKISALPRDVKGVRLRTKGVSYAGGGLVNDESYHVLLSSPNGDKTDTYKANIGTRISQNMQEIYIPISEFVSEDYSANGKNVPLTADALVNIDTIKIGVRNPQDRNQKRVALFHDDIEFVTDTSYFMNNIKCLSDKTKAIVTWEKPTAVYDEIRVYQDDVLKRTLPSGEIQTVFNGLTKGQKYIFKFEVMSGNVIKSVHTIETTSGDIDTAEKMEQTLLDNFFNTTPLAGTPENGGFLTSLLSGYEIVDKNINGLYWAFGENTMTATVKTSIALTKPEQLVIVLSENKEDGESYVAKIGDKITSADSWTTVEVPFADFVLLEEKKNNGKLDIGAISNVKIGRCESVESEYILSVCGFMPFDINGPKTTKLSLLTEKSFKINGEHTDVNMVGRGRVSLLSFDAAAFKGMTATNANLSLSLKKGQNNPVAVFLAPDDSWKTATQGKNVLFDGKNLDSDFKIFTDGGREKVFPAYAGNEKTTDTKNNDVLPTENERILDLESAGMGTMKDYFFGDYSLDCTKGMDISKTVNAALNRGDKTINIMLFTPYTLPATMDLYNTISAGVDTSKIPSLTMSYQKAYVMGEVLRDLNTVTVNVSVNVKNPNAWLFICGYTENNLCDVEVVKDIKDINTAEVSGDVIKAFILEKDTLVPFTDVGVAAN